MFSMDARSDRRGNRVLILTGGSIEVDFLREHLSKKEYDIIIAADYGLMAADCLSLSLDHIVGDFDSVPQEILEKYRGKGTPIVTYPAEKDMTDTQIALELALASNPIEIDIIGATGSRLDHTFANIHLLMGPLQQRISTHIFDSKNKIYLKEGSFSLWKNEQFGDFVSLLPFSENVKGLTLKGFKYPLDHIIMKSGSSLGISNEIVDEEAKVEFLEGVLMVIESKD